MGKLKVLQLCAVGFSAKKLLLPLIDSLKEEFDVSLACSRDKVSEELDRKGYRVHYVKINRGINPYKSIISLVKLYFLIKREKFDVVHTHTPVAGLLGRVAAKLAGVPIVIYTAHGFYFHENMPPFKRKIYKFFEKFGGLCSDFIFTQSSEDYKTAIEEKIISKDKVMAIGNGIDIQKFCPKNNISKCEIANLKRSLGISEEDVVIGIISRIVREKGYLELVRAAVLVLERCPKTKFLIVGDTLESEKDGVKEEIIHLIDERGISDRFVFTGIRDDIPELISLMDIYALPSYREGLPRSIIEAMSMKKPVIATNIRGCREEVVDGETGFLVPVYDHETLADKIIRLIEDLELRLSMGRKGRAKVENEYDERVVINKQIRVIKMLLARVI